MPVMLHLWSAPLLSSRKEVQTGVRPVRENHATVKVKPWSQEWLIAAGAYPGFCSMKQLGVFLPPPPPPRDRMLVHRRSLSRNLLGFGPQQFAGTYLYSWVERGTVRVKCLVQEQNTVPLARARTRTARSGNEHTNHEVTTPPRYS